MNRAEKVITLFEDRRNMGMLNAEADALLEEGLKLNILAQNPNCVTSELIVISKRVKLIDKRMSDIKIEMQLINKNLKVNLDLEKQGKNQEN